MLQFLKFAQNLKVIILTFLQHNIKISPFTGCNNIDRFCPEGLICKEEKCIFGSKHDCKSTNDCPLGLICKYEKCILESQHDCNSTIDCKLGYICFFGMCSKKLGPSKWTQHYVKYVNELQADLMRND